MKTLTFFGRVPTPVTGLITELAFSTNHLNGRKAYEVRIKVFDSIQTYDVFGESNQPFDTLEMGGFVDLDIGLSDRQFNDAEIKPISITELSVANIDNPFDYIPAQSQSQAQVKLRLSKDFEKLTHHSRAIVRHLIELRPDLFLQFIFKCNCAEYLTDCEVDPVALMIRSRFAKTNYRLANKPTPASIARFVQDLCKANKLHPIRLHRRTIQKIADIHGSNLDGLIDLDMVDRDFAYRVLILLEQNPVVPIPYNFLDLYKPSIDLIQGYWVIKAHPKSLPSRPLLGR